MLVLAILVVSVASTMLAKANSTGSLTNPNTLTIAGSSTVYPIANEEAGVWANYWNNLNGANPAWGANNCTAPVSLAGQGSGTAIPALWTNSADIGEMSRPPSNSATEWGNFSALQTWAVGIDSVAIVVSPDMTWFPTNLTTLQVANIFAALPTNGSQPYVTWGDFFAANGLSTSGVPAAALSENIVRAVRDPTSGTFDCFNNYFAVPNGFSFEHKTSGVVDASQNMATYTTRQRKS